MPIFEHNGTKYNVQDQYLVDFSKEYPEATTISERDGNKYRVKAADYINFLVESGAHIPVKSPLHPMNIGHLEEDKLQSNRSAFIRDLQPQYAVGVREGVKEGTKALKQGVRYLAGEVSNKITGTSRDDAEALDVLNRRIAAEGRIMHEQGTWVGRMLKKWAGNHILTPPSIAKNLNTKAYESKINKIINDAIQDAEGDLDVARSILAQRAQDKSWGDEIQENASEEMGKIKPSKGFGAWVGYLIPQMVPAGAAVAASVITKNPKFATLVANVGMGAMTAATAGQSMKEARDAGATDAEVWTAGIVDGFIEYVTEKIPFDRYTKRIFGNTKAQLRKDLSNAVADSNSPSRKELEKLLASANNKLGGKLLGGKTAKKLAADMLAEGSSEFMAEAMQTITPILYENPEDYPNLIEILANGWEGAKAGLFMGSVIGGASKMAEHRVERQRRKKQGFVDVAQIRLDDKTSDIVEIVGRDKETGNIVILDEGDIREIPEQDVVVRYQFPFKDFEAGILQKQIDDIEADEQDENVPFGTSEINPQVEQAVEVARQEAAEIINKDDNTVYEVETDDGITGYIIGGKGIVVDDDGRINQSEEDTVAVKTDEGNRIVHKERVKVKSRQTLQEIEDLARGAAEGALAAVQPQQPVGGKTYQGIYGNEPVTITLPREIKFNEDGTVDYDNLMNPETVSVIRPNGAVVDEVGLNEIEQLTEVQPESGQVSVDAPAVEQQEEVQHVSETKMPYELSDEVDENGRQFVKSSTGAIEFGQVDAESGLAYAPILLSEGMITNKATNDGYGLVHIEARHGDQIRKAGYNTVVEFVEDVAKNYEVIKEGNVRDGHNTYLLQLKDKHNNTLMVELSGDGTYWNINTAGVFKTSYGKNRKEVYNRHTTAKQPAETIEASRNPELSGTQGSPSMVTASTLVSSDNKDTTSEPNNQEVAQKNVTETAPVAQQPQIPLQKNGEPDYNAMDAEMFTEQYVARFGEGATERIARNNIKVANKTISTIEKQIEDVTDPNKMPALYAKLQAAQATKDKYAAVLEELGLSADESEDNAARVQRKKQENTSWFNKLFPEGFPNVESVILWDIANGNRIRWTNKEVNGAVVSKGLGSELGLADSNAERTRRVALIGKDATTPEEYAEQLPERLKAMGVRFEEGELRDKVIDVYTSVDTVRKAKEELEKMSANIQAEQEGLDYEEEQMRRNYEREQEALRQEAQADVVDEQTEQEQPTNEETQEEELSIEDEVPFMVSSENSQAVTEAQQLATEAAITALEDAGVEVVNATPEMVEEALQRRDVRMQAVNQKFNEQLAAFNEENATALIFDLGMPSPMLIAGGVPNKPIRLYGSKLLKKIRKHGFSAAELSGLPMALANPIAVFNNYQREGNRSVLIELSTADGNFLVSIDIGVGSDIDFDIVKSVFGKDGDGILNWINKGYLTTVDKEKALAYLRISAPIAEASNKQELDSATKIVENFENPKIVPGNSFSIGPAPVFVSNAKIVVLGIKQEKATPEQWLKMIEKAGGLKAGEDKWIGLSDWLKTSEKKTLTKQEVLDYINENQIQIEETTYSSNDVVETTSEFKALQEEFRTIADNYIAQTRRNLEEFEVRMEQKYGFTDVFDTTALNEDEYRAHVSLSQAIDESYNAAWTEMVERYGDDFEIAFWNFGDGVIKVDNAEAAGILLGLPIDKPIFHLREDYTTKGLEGNREIALTVPTIEPWNENDEIHFGDAGEGRAIAWARFGETTDADGKRVLVIDEIQSKRHQEGREKGYRPSDVDKYLKDNNVEVVEAGEFYEFYRNGELDRRFSKGLLHNNIKEAKNLYVAGYNKSNIPEAPFEKNWAELAMKRMLRYAAENGFDKVAWTKGNQQVDRYSLAKLYDAIEREDNPSINGKRFVLAGGNYDNFIVGDTGIIVASSINEAVGKSLEEVVGQDMASKMLSLEDGDSISGDNLRIGGEGMRAFYNEMLPRFMNKYGKKWGVKVKDVTLPFIEEAGRTMHSVDVTDSMRESVMQGQPMFYRRPNGTVYGWTNGTTVYLTESGMNPNTPIHEYTHIWADAMRKHNPDGWASIVKLLKGTPVWNEVMADTNYANIHGNENQVASEALSRISGRENAAKMEAMAQQMIDENANDTVKKHRARKLLDRMRKALQEFWSWVGKELFGIKNFDSIEQVTDRILYDLVSGTDLTSVSSFDTPAAERNEIISKAKANGTYLKAPNGKDTNLTPEQWVTVRTKAFKRWFGDWEKTARIEKLRRSAPIAIPENAYEGKYELNQASAEKYIKDNLRSEYRIEDTGEVVKLTNRSAKKLLSHSYNSKAHLQSIVAIPEMIQKAVFIDETTADKDNARFDSYRYYVCGVKIGSEDYTARITIGVKDGAFYYDHALTEIEKGNLIEIAQGFTPSGGHTLPSYAKSKDTRIIPLLQTDSSKIVDANGEPLVVWHGGEFAIDEFVANGSMHFGTKVAALQRILDNAWGYGNWSVARNDDGNWTMTRKSDDRWWWRYEDPDDPDYNRQAKKSFARPIDALVDAARIAAPKAVVRPYFLNIRNLERTNDKVSAWTSAVSFSMDAGHDGIIYRNEFEDKGEDSYVAFYPNQIKLADGSNTTFDPDNDDIRFSVDTELRKRTEKIASEAQKIADKFGLSNEIVVAETQEDFVEELQGENIADELIYPDAIAVFTPSGRIMVNAQMISDMAELPDSIMHEFAHNVTHSESVLYRLQDSVLEVGEERFEVAGREIFGQTADPLEVADEIIATFVGNAANPTLYDGEDLVSRVFAGYSTEEAIRELLGSLPPDLHNGYADVAEAVMPYIKEVLDEIKTNHDGPRKRARASEDYRETQAETGRVRARAQGYSGRSEARVNRFDNEADAMRGAETSAHTKETRGENTAEQTVRVGNDSLLEGVNEFSIGSAPIASEEKAKLDSRTRLIAELRQKLRDLKTETRTVAAEVGKMVRKAITPELIDKMGKRTFDNIVRTIETATVRRDVEYAVNRIEEAVLDIELRDKQDKFDKYLNLRVQGESARGVSIAANVTDQVRQFITIIRDNLDRPASEVEALIEERGGSLAERTGLQVLGFYQDARNFEREVQEIEDEIEKIKSENAELRKKRAALNKAGKTNDAKNLSDQINANKETIEHLNAERISTKRSQLYYIDMAANELEREIAYGKEGHKEWLQQEAKRKQELLKIAWNDIRDGKNIPILDEQEPIWKKTKNAVVDFLLAPAYSWDYLLKMISVNAPNGEGALYDHFMRSENGYVAASGNYYQAYEDFKARLNEKAKDIFGKDYKQVLKDSDQPLGMTTPISTQGASDIYTPTIGEAVYAYMVAKMPDGRVKLDNMKLTEDKIDMLVRMIPQQYIDFADWVQNEFLPERRKVYNKTHLEVFGTQMAQIENYVPLKIKKDYVYEKFDGSKIDKAELPSSITGSIIKRKRNALPIDLRTNIFDLLLDHGQQMEHWNAYTRIVRDTNQFLSDTQIRRALDYRKKGLHRKLEEAALIASNRYKPDVDRMEKMTVALSKMAASSKIAFRINTAIKQVLSYPAFYAYVADAHFWGYLTRNLSPDTWGRNFRWALDNIPSFQERWLGRMAGDDRLAQMTSPQLDRWIKGMGNVGMLPNALVDAVTCANGAQAVYRYEHERYLKIGLDEPEADRLAKIAAAQALNQTQQSSEGMYLSRIQADRTAFAVAISTFQNSNFAYLRKELEGIDQLMRDTKKQIANREKYYEQQGVNPDQAAKLALQDVVSANRTAVAKILVFGFILNTIWTLGNSVWKYAFGDDDEEDKWEDAAIRGFFNSFTRNLSVGQYVETVAWSDFRELNPSLLLSDLNMFIERLESIAEGNVKMWDRTAAWTVLSTLSSLGLGVDINSFASMCESVQGAIDNGANVEDIMLLVNAPRSQAKFIAGPPKEGETLDEYTKRQAWIERKIVSRIDKKQLDKWSRNYEAYKQAEMLGVPYSRDKMGRVSVPYIKDIDDSYSALLKSVGRTKSGAKRNDGDLIADDVKTRIRDFGLIKRIKDINALEKNLDAMVILDGAYPERLKELCEAKQQLIEEWNQ